MRTNCETLLDDNGIELLVGYKYEPSNGYYEEQGNPGTWVASMVYTELTSVELVICGRGIDVLPVLTEREKQFVISKLQYED